MAKKIEEAVITEPSFSKEQIIKSKKYRESADVIGALLRDGESYSFKQVDKMLADFMKREVKGC